MRERRPLIVVAVGVVIAVALFVLLRPASEGAQQGAPAPTATTTIPTATATQTTPPTPKPVRIVITVRGGKPVGGIRRNTVRKDARVVYVVRADVHDHVHLHGYDLMHDVASGQPATLRFRATLVGGFEAELEDRRLPIAHLTVRP